MANAGDLRVISQAVTSVSQELAVLIDDVRTYLIFHVCLGPDICLIYVQYLIFYGRSKKINKNSITGIKFFFLLFTLTSMSSLSSHLSPALRR